jgi:UDP-2,3-diacylglucosamine pyrophosphatase LpxH
MYAMEELKLKNGRLAEFTLASIEELVNTPATLPFAHDAPSAYPAGPPPREKRRFRSIWISDLHLGTRGCKVDFLLDFLRTTESEYLYLAGDIIDAWQLKRSWYWPQTHNEVLRLFLRKAGRGTKVFYIPGNHDEFFRGYTDMRFGGVSLINDMIHEAADGKRYLIIHGDAYDGVVAHAKWLALLGGWSYKVALALNGAFNKARRRLGYPYWSLSAYLKHKVKNAVNFISDFEHTLAAEARKRHVDGVVCGHIHKADLRDIEGVIYANDGDWVESCTALVEHNSGRMEILHWTEERNLSFHDTIQ